MIRFAGNEQPYLDLDRSFFLAFWVNNVKLITKNKQFTWLNVSFRANQYQYLVSEKFNL